MMGDTSKREYILEFLRERGSTGAYAYEIFKSWREMAVRYPGKSVGSYQNFRVAIGVLKKQGIIEPFRQEASKKGWAKTYYRMAGGVFI